MAASSATARSSLAPSIANVSAEPLVVKGNATSDFSFFLRQTDAAEALKSRWKAMVAAEVSGGGTKRSSLKVSKGVLGKERRGRAMSLSDSEDDGAVTAAYDADSAEAVWLLGSGVANVEAPSGKKTALGETWVPELSCKCVLEADTSVPGAAVRDMCVDNTESWLLTCLKNGHVKLWSLRAHPVLQVSTFQGHTTSLFASRFLHGRTKLVACDGSLHMWDVESRNALFKVPPSGYGEFPVFTAMTTVPVALGVTPGLENSGEDQILTTSATSVHHIDPRCGWNGADIVSEWRIITPNAAEAASDYVSGSRMPSLRCVCVMTSSTYLCVGSSTGHLWLLDRRYGRPVHLWAAHEDSVLRVAPCGENRLVSVGLDRIATRWNVNGEREAKLRGLPDGPLSPSAVYVHTFVSNANVLYVAGGHKVCMGKIPSDTAKSEIKLERSNVWDRSNNKIPRQRLAIQSLALLPLRKLILLGTEDGLIRVCT